MRRKVSPKAPLKAGPQNFGSVPFPSPLPQNATEQISAFSLTSKPDHARRQHGHFATYPIASHLKGNLMGQHRLFAPVLSLLATYAPSLTSEVSGN